MSLQTASVSTDPSVVEEIRTTLYVDSARLKVLSQETKIHADNDDPARLIVPRAEPL